MFWLHPDLYLHLVDQDRALAVQKADRRRLAAAQSQLYRDEARVRRAWMELSNALADSSDSRRRLAELMPL